MEELLQQAVGIARDVWRYRWLALAVAWGICLLAWPVVLFLPNKYEAHARVFVDPSTALKPVIQGIAIEQDVNSELNFVKQSLLSRAHLQKIVNETGLGARVSNQQAMAGVLDDLSERIDIVAQAPTANSGDVPTPGKVYTISYRDGDRNRSLKVVQILLDSFMEGTLGGNRRGSATAQRFVEAQIKEYEVRLGDAEQRLAEFKKRNVGMVPGGQQSDYFSRLQNEIDAGKKTQTALGIAVTRRSALEGQLRGEAPSAAGTAPSGMSTSKTGPQGGGDTLSRIQETQAKLDDMLLRFTEKHPDVIALRETLEELKQRRARELEALKRGDAGAAAASGASSNPVYQSIQLQLNQADVEIAGLRGELADHQQKVSELRRMVDTMPQVEAEFARLNRDYSVTKGQYTALVDRLEKARLGEEAGASGLVRFEIIDPPTADFNPVSPKRSVLLALVLLAALAGGAGAAYSITMIKPVFHTAQQLGDITGAVVLGVVSATRTVGNSISPRREYVTFSLACSLLMLALVIVVFVGRTFTPLGAGILR